MVKSMLVLDPLCWGGLGEKGGGPALVPEEDGLDALQAEMVRRLAGRLCGCSLCLDVLGNGLTVRSLRDWRLEGPTFEGKIICLKM